MKDESFTDRLMHGWNAFRNRNPSEHNVGAEIYGNRPHIPTRRMSSDRSILAAIYARIAVDIASTELKHAKVDDNENYLETIKSGLNECLNIEANIDQSGRAFLLDISLSLFDEGVIAIVPVDTTIDPRKVNTYEINSMRVAKIISWYPQNVKIRLYNDRTGKQEEIVVPKKTVAIVENPFYSVMNEPNSTLQRLKHKMNLLDALDDKIGSGKIDLLINLPYTVRGEKKIQMAKDRVDMLTSQLEGNRFGIGYVDATEKITQLNRPVENTLVGQIEEQTSKLYSQLGLSDKIMNGTASEEEMLRYHSGTIEPFLDAISDAMIRSFLTKTARTRGHTIKYFRDPFKLVPISKVAEVGDVLIRNEIATANEVRSVIGFKPHSDEKANELRNPNMPQDLPMEEGGDDEILNMVEELLAGLESDIDSAFSDE